MPGRGAYGVRMAMTIEQLAEEALASPSEQRALLADRLVESLDTAEANRIDGVWPRKPSAAAAWCAIA